MNPLCPFYEIFMRRVLECRWMHSILHMIGTAYLVLLEALFGIGIAGSTVVLILSFWDDMKTILGHH